MVGMLVLLSAWFAMSNHCALAVMTGALAPSVKVVEKHCCPSQQGTGEHQEDSPSGVCCKSVRALIFDEAKLAKPPAAVLLAELAWALIENADQESSRSVAITATVPPEVRSFAEVVLQRSLRTHAPPFAA